MISANEGGNTEDPNTAWQTNNYNYSLGGKFFGESSTSPLLYIQMLLRDGSVRKKEKKIEF